MNRRPRWTSEEPDASDFQKNPSKNILLALGVLSPQTSISPEQSLGGFF